MKLVTIITITIILSFLAGALLFGKYNLGSFLPLIAIVLICPILMMFMMRDKH